MPKTKISEFSSTPANNTDIDSINIAEGCAPSGINDAIRELMSQLKDWQSGTSNDPYVVGSSGSLTLNQGTANGVPYLNGSKVVTSGSALTFDGTNFGVGTTSPASLVAVAGSTSTTLGLSISAGGWNNARHRLTVPSSGDESVWSWNYTGSAVDSSSYGTASIGLTSNAIKFATATTNTAPSEQMRLTSTGLGIGTSSPLTKLHVQGTDVAFTANTLFDMAIIENGASGNGAALQIVAATNGSSEIGFSDTTRNIGKIGYDHNSNAMLFDTNGSERCRIDSSGNLLVNTTSNPNASHQIWKNNSNGIVASLQNTNTTNGYVLDLVSQSASGTGFSLIRGYVGGSTQVFTVLGNGNVQNTNNSYGAISDVKLKENIVDTTPKLANLMQVQVRNYNLIGETTKQIGVVAQELETVFPAMVDETSDKDAEGNDLGTTTKSVKYSVFVPMLIKAMQEQQTIIESLTTRITALEGK
jgi:hypothetical protein